jgi:hypothetical protein
MSVSFKLRQTRQKLNLFIVTQNQHLTELLMYAAGRRLGFRMARSVATLAPTPRSTHSLPALDFASQSPYTGRQTVINNRALSAIIKILFCLYFLPANSSSLHIKYADSGAKTNFNGFPFSFREIRLFHL